MTSKAGRPAPADLQDVTDRIRDAGALDRWYLVMTGLSAAITILGLLLSSPAVVIGAMVLSPLLGPIVKLGFSFLMVDWRSMRAALATLGLGFTLACAVAVLVTLASPLKEPTAEILSRARPTLFDLLVAVFSGAAGTYALIRRKGAAIMGVAIATALMPPVATVGFGLATGDWLITRGALLLFATNFVAIALSAAGVAAAHGFRPARAHAAGGWPGRASVLLVVAALCVPLTVSLRTIVLESRATTAARARIDAIFGPKARLVSLEVRNEDGAVRVEALVATPRYRADAAARATAALRRSLSPRVSVKLTQVIMAHPQEAQEEAPAASPPSPAPTPPSAAERLAAAVPFPAARTFFDAATGQGLVQLAPASGLDLRAARALEQGLRARPGLAQVRVAPPVAALAPVAAGDAQALADAVWALRRWRAAAVVATVCASPREVGAARRSLLAALASARLSVRSLTLRRCPARAGRIDLAPARL